MGRQVERTREGFLADERADGRPQRQSREHPEAPPAPGLPEGKTPTYKQERHPLPRVGEVLGVGQLGWAHQLLEKTSPRWCTCVGTGGWFARASPSMAALHPLLFLSAQHQGGHRPDRAGHPGVLPAQGEAHGDRVSVLGPPPTGSGRPSLSQRGTAGWGVCLSLQSPGISEFRGNSFPLFNEMNFFHL